MPQYQLGWGMKIALMCRQMNKNQKKYLCASIKLWELLGQLHHKLGPLIVYFSCSPPSIESHKFHLLMMRVSFVDFNYNILPWLWFVDIP